MVGPGSESALQLNVPELVDRACLSQLRTPRRWTVGEKAHQQPRQPVVQHQPPSGERGSLAATHPACEYAAAAAGAPGGPSELAHGGKDRRVSTVTWTVMASGSRTARPFAAAPRPKNRMTRPSRALRHAGSPCSPGHRGLMHRITGHLSGRFTGRSLLRESGQQLAHGPRERWLVDGDVGPGRSDDDVAVNGDSPSSRGHPGPGHGVRAVP